jgi:hypothetical protein
VLLSSRRKEECEELCRKRVYLEKILRGTETDYDRCVEICRAVAKLIHRAR